MITMRILHTEWSDGLGGQEKRVLAEAEGLARRGHHVVIACREHARIKDEAEKSGLAVRTFPLKKPYDIGSIVGLAHFIKENKFDVVNTHSGVDSWIGGLASKLSGTPVLARTRHLNIPLKRSMLNFIHYLPDIYITCGENMRDNLIRKCGFPAGNVVSIPTGADPSFSTVTKNRAAGKKYGLDMDSRVITYVGILRSVKGHEVTLRAVKTVVESNPAAKFLIVGDGPRKAALEDYVNDLRISDHVIFSGFVNDIAEIYSFTDVAVLSSWSEGLPQSLLQAMAAGVPVVATRVGGVPEVVIHEKTGLLVEPGDHEALSNGLIKILNNEGLASQLVENARELIEKEYSLDHMIDKIEGLYGTLLKQKGYKSD
jgi:glycosyltransferase involved in cell wall biosynthesis